MAWPWHLARPFVGNSPPSASSPSRSQGAWRRVDPRATSAYGARLHDPPPPKLRDGRSRKGRDDMTDTHVGRRGLTVGLAALGAAALARLAAPRRAEGSQ